MVASSAVEVAIGLVFVYLIFSLFCSAIQEWIARLFALRASGLRNGLTELLHDKTLGAAFSTALHDHPLIDALKPPRRPTLRRSDAVDYPSYIAPQTFALAVMDLMARGQQLPASLQALLRGLVPATDAELIRRRLEQWFDDSMGRLSGWYKRRTQAVLYLIGLVATLALNIDTVRITRQLTKEPATRAALAAEAAAIDRPGTTVDSVAAKLDRHLAALDASGVALGWPDGFLRYHDGAAVAAGVLGLAMTTLALSLGAPFWFDALNKLGSLRQTGTPPGEKKK
jgi:hypothetical protein